MVDERSHYGMAKNVLGPAWRGDADDAYADMWHAGWARVRIESDEVYGELYINGRKVPFENLSKAQRGWFRDQALGGLRVQWNDSVFEATREPAKSLAQQLLEWTPAAGS